MKTSPIRYVVATLTLALTASLLSAAPVTETTPIYAKADAGSPAIGFVKAGAEPNLPALPPAAVPAGWTAVELPGPHEVYVQNKDITKSLEVRPGAELRKAPKADAPVLALAAAGEPLDITGLQGRWTQLRLNRSLIGYIKRVAPSVAALPAASAPGSATRANPPTGSTAPAPVAPPPSKPAAYGAAGGGQPAPMVNLGDGGSSLLPRTFEGRFVSTRSPFKPRRPYDYALTDDSGSRFAYVDVSRLLQTEQIEKYVDRTISVYGTAKPLPNSKDFVIVVESLQLK